MKTRPSFSRRFTAATAFALAAFAGVSVASAQTPVFQEDFTTIAPGTTVNGLVPTVGGAINVTEGAGNGINNGNLVNGGSFTIQNETLTETGSGGFSYFTTDGAQRVVNMPFTAPLGANQTITITVDFEAPGGNFFSGGFAGFRVETAATDVADGGSGGVLFVGDTNDQTSGFDLATGSAGGTGEQQTGYNAGFVSGTGQSLANGIAVATLTYAYNTGVANLTVTGPTGSDGLTSVSATLDITPDQQLNGLQFENNNGGDQRVSGVLATVVTAPSGSVTWTGKAAGVNNSSWDISTLNWQSGGTAVAYVDNVGGSGAGDNVTFDDTATGTHTVQIASTVHPASVTVNTASSYTINAPSGADGIDGAASLTISSGTLNLNGTNGYQGLTTVQSGTLSISSGASIFASPIITLGNDTGTTTGNLTDNGTVAEQTVTGAFVTAGGSTATDTVNVTTAGDILNISGALSGDAPLTKSGNGQLTFSGTIAGYTQAINLNGGTLSLNGAQNGVININSASAVLDYSGTRTGTGSIVATTAATITASNASASAVLTGNNNSFSGSLTYGGPGQLTLSGSTAIVGALTVNGGRFTLLSPSNTISVAPVVNSGGTLEYAPGALGTGAGNSVTLNSGTLALKFTGGGLTGNYYNITATSDNGNNGDSNFNTIAAFASFIGTQTPALTAPTTTGGQTNLDFGNPGGGVGSAGDGNGPAFASQGFTSEDNYEVQLVGYINIATAGSYTFSTASDDGSVLGIDGNTVVQNNFFQGTTTRSGTLTLTAGVHQIDVGYYQGGGGNALQVIYSGPGIANQIIPNSVLNETPNPTFNDTTVVTLNGTSAIDPEGAFATIGSINFNAASSLEVKTGTLSTINGVNLQTTTAGPNPFTITVDSGGIFEPVTLATTHAADTVTIHLEGQGSMVLSSASGPLNNAGTVLDLGGSGLSTLILVDQTSIGAATINFSGGGLAVTSSTGGTVNLSVPYTYSPGGNGSITAGAPGFGVSGGTVNVTSPNVPASSTLFLGSANGYIMNVVGTPTGGGNIGISSGLVNIGANGGGTGSAIDGLGLTFIPAVTVTATANIAANSTSLIALNATSAGTSNLVVGTGNGTPVVNLNDQGNNNTFNGTISSSTANNPTLNKSGAGTLTLGGTSTLGAVNVNGGAVALNVLGAVGTANVSLANNTTLTFAATTGGVSLGTPTLSGFAGNQTNGTNAANAISGGGTTITLTVGTGNEATSVFSTSQYSTLSGFQASYVYQALPGNSGAGNLADGTAFVIQSVAPTAIGGGGGALAYAGGNIVNSGAVEFNLYPGNPPGGIAFASSGAAQTGAGAGGYQSVAPVSLPSGDPILVQLSYNGIGTLIETLTDQTTSQTYTTTYTNFDLNAALIGDEGYVGFTGADGGANSIQTVTDFTFSNATVVNYSNSVSVANGASATLQLNNNSSVTGLTLGTNATLNVTAVNAVPNAPYNFSVVGATTLNGADVFTIANNGSGLGSVTLNAVGQAAAGSSLTVNGPGTLILAGAATYTGATNVNSGTLAVAVGGSISGNKINVQNAAIFDVTALTSSGGYTVPTGQSLNVASGGAVNGSLNVSGTLTGLGGLAGDVNGNVTVNSGGVLTPGNQGGEMVVTGNLTTNTGGALNIEIGGLGPLTDSVVLSSTSTLTLAGPLTGSLFGGYQPVTEAQAGVGDGDVLFIVTGSQNPVQGVFSNQSTNPDVNGFNTVTLGNYIFEVSYTGSFLGSEFSGAGNDVALEALQAVPEPSSLLLLGAGALCGLGRFRRKSA